MSGIPLGKPSKYYTGQIGDLVKENPLHQEAVNSMPVEDIKIWINNRYEIGYCSPYKPDCFGYPIGFVHPGVGDYIADPNEPFAIAYENGTAQFREKFVKVLGDSLEEKITKLEQKREEQKPDDKDARFISYGFGLVSEKRLRSFENLIERVISPKFDFEYRRPHPYMDEEVEIRNLRNEAVKLLTALRET